MFGWGKKSDVYALVFVYDSKFGNCTYICREGDYFNKQIVVVDKLGKLYAGRILGMSEDRPEGIPRNVQFKRIIKPFSMKDVPSLDYWNEDIEKVVKESL